MKIAFPVEKESGAEQEVSLHFGPSPWFAVMGGDGKAGSPIKNTSAHFGGSMMPVELLAGQGVKAIICCDMGPKAVEMCEKFAVEAYFVPAGTTVREAFAMHAAGKLAKAKNGDGCKSHSK
ncbi:MAG: NifB/NifX family molybdenum-iron cluster-binding protein [Candidatus Micrarchaeia archaeon]